MNDEKKKDTPTFKTAEVITLVLITCVVSLLMGIIISKPNKEMTYEPADSELQNFIKQYNYIVDNYYGDVDKKQLLEGALEGMIDALGDPYSSYLDEESSSTLNAELNGSYDGIGIEVANDSDKNIIITKVFDNTPAKEAGLEPLDIIIGLDNQKIDKMTTSELTTLIKKMTKSSFILEIKRGNDTKKVTVTKKKVILDSVVSKVIDKDNKKIGYMYVSIFAMNTDNQFQTQLSKLENAKINSLIIDLRGNSGGHLSSVENMMSLFMDKTKIIYQIENKSKTTKYYSKGKENKKYPIVLLIDGGSASASEMMAAALKESYGAILVGKTTYGKGTVQELQDSNNDQYKITTKKWLTPNGNWINEKGIKPDFDVELDKKYFSNPSDENDSQLQKALELLTK